MSEKRWREPWYGAVVKPEAIRDVDLSNSVPIPLAYDQERCQFYAATDDDEVVAYQGLFESFIHGCDTVFLVVDPTYFPRLMNADTL